MHTARSLYEYASNRVLRRSWLGRCFSLRFMDGALAVVFCVILCGGLITGSAARVHFSDFTVISALVALFSPVAADWCSPQPPGQ